MGLTSLHKNRWCFPCNINNDSIHPRSKQRHQAGPLYNKNCFHEIPTPQQTKNIKPNTGLMLCRRHWCWTTLSWHWAHCLSDCIQSNTRLWANAGLMLGQLFDADPTLNQHWLNASCLMVLYICWANSTENNTQRFWENEQCQLPLWSLILHVLVSDIQGGHNTKERGVLTLYQPPHDRSQLLWWRNYSPAWWVTYRL